MKQVLIYARALYQMYQNFHWRSAGPQYYGDHLLYERLYGDLQGELDQLAEKTLGTGGELEPVSDGKAAADLLDKLTSDTSGTDDFPKEAIIAEEGFLEVIRDIPERPLSDGVENLLQGIADKHEEHLYLLKQRVKTAGVLERLAKLANKLDKEGLYNEANTIDEVIFKNYAIK